MRRKAFLFVLSSVLALAVAGTASADMQTLDLSEKDGIGKFLVDGKGMTLYIFRKDSPGKSVCEGQCTQWWPLFQGEASSVPAGMNAADFGAITRGDGRKQATFKGWPLYYYYKDKNPGDALGQGKGGAWYVVTP